MSGKFIVLESLDGAGKGTVVRNLQQHFAEAVFTREPGGSLFGEHLREYIVNFDRYNLTKETLLLLFKAQCVQHVHETVLPNLREGRIVISERFTDSTLAYQLSDEEDSESDRYIVNAVIDKHLIHNQVEPDLVIILDVPTAVSESRVAERGEDKDSFESLDVSFKERVRNTYLALAEKNNEKYKVVDATQDAESVFKEVVSLIEHVL